MPYNQANPNEAYVPSFMGDTPAPAPVTPQISTGVVVPTAQQVVNSTRTGSDYGSAIVRDYEQFKPEAYWDANGKKWTIGWGFTTLPNGKPVKEGDKISQASADSYLSDILKRNEKTLSSRYPKAWSQMQPHEKGALLDLAHNLGPEWSKFPILDKLLRADKLDRAGVAREIPTFRRSGGQIVEGLVNRRKDTLGMWSGDYKDGYVSRAEREQRKRAKPKN